VEDVKSTANAGSNIALIKYWGNRDDELRLPMNGSISMTLDAARTTTTVAFDRAYDEDEVSIDGEVVQGAVRERVSKFLNRVREMADTDLPARVVSRNSFPTGAGMASSASGFAALAAAATSALEMGLSDRELSILSRLGSGSACRSIFGGFVEWVAGARHPDSYAFPLASVEHWHLVDVIAVVSAGHKEVGSTEGHPLAGTSPFYAARLAQLQDDLPAIRGAVLNRDFTVLGTIVEREALSMHGVMLTSCPSLLYWNAGTVEVMKAVRRWRREGIEAYFTMDAGPNVHVLTLPTFEQAISESLLQLDTVERCITCGPGEGVQYLESHLF
jgi:diphosphomevalonate decarboxylase